MNVDSLLFISCFMPLVLLLHSLIRQQRPRNFILLAAGLVFCAFGSLSGLLLLVALAGVNYFLGLGILGGKRPKLFCAAGVTLNLAFLVFFKYLDFLLAEVLGLPHLALGLAAPLGISFYTFKCISYLVDAFRNREPGTRRFWDFLLYVSFFPQLAAGPISRFSQFGTCLTHRTVTSRKIAEGLRRFVVGLGKKLLLSAVVGTVVDKVFAGDDGSVHAVIAWLGAVAYMLQLYFDFSGYSDMAIGLGQAFGFETPENFQYPYGAYSVTDFWRRWHISLSTWFKDYLYIPLGGNRKGKARAAVNKAIVFLLCGIWHGAAWTFVLWGLWHGLFSALESARCLRPKQNFLSRIYTLLVVCLGFVMFRAGSVSQGFRLIGAMFTGFSGFAAAMGQLSELLTGEAILALLAAAVLAQPVLPALKRKQLGLRYLEPAAWVGCVVLFLLCLMKLAAGGFTPFIYTRF